MKHLFQFSLLLLVLLLPATASAHDFEVEGIYYNINGNEATVTYKGTYGSQYSNEYSGDVTIPATVTYGGTTYSVTSIGDEAFYGCSGLTSITIPNSVTSIGNYAFWYCTSLTSIDIPNSVTSIGGGAFSDTPWYDNQPDGLVYAGLVAYKYKGTMLSGTSITIRDGTLGIARSAFSSCSGLTSVAIPNSVISIGYWAFSDCVSLTSIVVASGNTTFDSRNNCNSIIETASNTLIVGCKNTVIPNSVISIGDDAFYDCSGLTSIAIPNSVTSIGNYAFQGCSGLTSVTIPNSVTTIGIYAFKYCSALTSIDIPNSVAEIGRDAFASCSSLTSIVVASGNSKYDSRGNCSAIIETATNTLIAGCKSTAIPNTVIAIANDAFSGCRNLTSIFIPNSVTIIGDGAFSYCTGLTSITIPNSVTSIGNFAFSRCVSLTSISIGNSVTSIGDYAFSNCSGLTEIYCFALVPPTIDTETFYRCYGATLYVPEEAVNAYKAADYWKNFNIIAAIGSLVPGSTFVVDGIYYLVTDANMVSVIANEEVDAFYTGDVIIPASVTYEEDTFAVTGIENNAFEDCYELTSVTIPNSVETIGEQAFQGCTGLTSVTIGSGVTAIGAKAFNYCNALETVKCLGTVPPVMASTDCFSTAAYNRATLLVPRQFVEVYQAADYWYKFAHIEGWGSAGRGDIDGDGAVSIRDVTTLIDAILNGNNEGIYFESADVNLNGRLDIGDVTTIIDMLLNDIE